MKGNDERGSEHHCAFNKQTYPEHEGAYTPVRIPKKRIQPLQVRRHDTQPPSASAQRTTGVATRFSEAFPSFFSFFK